MEAAQRYAEQLASTNTGCHSSVASMGQYGENLAKCCRGRCYDKANPAITNAGCVNVHYTALAWKASTTLGCGMATTGSGCTIVVSNYGPPGNVNYPSIIQVCRVECVILFLMDLSLEL
jgi:hypothetical protein